MILKNQLILENLKANKLAFKITILIFKILLSLKTYYDSLMKSVYIIIFGFVKDKSSVLSNIFENKKSFMVKKEFIY